MSENKDEATMLDYGCMMKGEVFFDEDGTVYFKENDVFFKYVFDVKTGWKCSPLIAELQLTEQYDE